MTTHFSKIADAKKQPFQAYQDDKFDESFTILLHLKKPLLAHSGTVVSSQVSTRQDEPARAFSFGEKMKTKVCPHCETWFQTKQHNQKFCSPKCKWTFTNRNRQLQPNLTYDCKVCGKHVETYISPSSLFSGKYTAEFCSRTCAGRARSGENHPQWKGGVILEADGYVMIYVPEHPHANNKGYVFEHRLMMEEKLERYLEPQEVVHHINNNRSDNRIENLHLYESNAEHKREDIVFRKRDEKGRLLKENYV